MIKFKLKCAHNHSFESWFKNQEGFETLKMSRLIRCPICQSHDVEKTLMSPTIHKKAEKNTKAPQKAKHSLKAPASKMEADIKKLKAKIESHFENVGDNFAKEARAIHDGDAPKRAIYGEANVKEAQSLIEDGISVTPLPWGRKRTN